MRLRVVSNINGRQTSELIAGTSLVTHVVQLYFARSNASREIRDNFIDNYYFIK